MTSFVKLYSNQKGEIERFLSNFLLSNDDILNDINENTLEFQINYSNPIIMSDIIGTFIDNKEDFKLNMWLCLDENVLINVTQNNADDIIRYLYERFPY